MAAPKPAWDEGTIYVRHTNKEGSITYQEHRCWNVGVFFQNLARAAADVGGEARVDRVDETTYARWKTLQRQSR